MAPGTTFYKSAGDNCRPLSASEIEVKTQNL